MRWRPRKLEKNINKAKELKKELKKAKNSVEAKRIMIMINYLSGNNTDEVVKMMIVGKSTVMNSINRYIKDPENFYKTKFTGKRRTKESNMIVKKIDKIIKKKEENKEYMDINDILEAYNRSSKGKKISYRKCWEIVRKVLRYNYQKPYIEDTRQSEYAKEILSGRLRKAITKIGIEEKLIDADDIKNKKTKFWEN